MVKKGFSNVWFVFSLVLLSAYFLYPKTATALETEQENFNNNNKEDLIDLNNIPFLNRFKFKDKLDGSGFDDEERRSIYYGYKEGRVGEEDYSKFFYSSTEKPSNEQSWRRISFSVFDRPNKKVRLEVNPKDKAIKLNFAIKLH